MNLRRAFFRFVFPGCVSVLVAPFFLPISHFAAAQEADRPNIVVILADDLGVETLGTYGGSSYSTPELDRLAAEGMRFDHGHSQPLCTPTRVKLMTGLHNYRNYREFAQLDPGQTTFAHVLSQAGYRTVIAGKWQLANNPFVVGEGAYPGKAGFDEHRLWQVRHERRGSRYWGPTLVTNGVKETWKEDIFGPDLINEFVLDAIDEHAAAEPAIRKPLFIYYPMVLPHDPFVNTPHHPDATTQEGRFAAMVAYMDYLVGRVRARLVKHGLDRNTLMLFIGDNGTSSAIASTRNGRAVRGGKGAPLQTGTHVPFLAWWPGTISPGRTSQTLVDVGDVFPTLAEVASAELPEGLEPDGASLFPVLRGASELERSGLFVHYEPRWSPGPPVRYVFDHRFKRYEDGRLFDLVADPGERMPIALGDAPPETAAQIAALDALLASKAGSIRTAGAWRPPEGTSSQWRPPAERPNILFFIADDMTYGDAGAFGNPAVHTPNIDRLAASGATFTHMFAGSAMCSPARRMLYDDRCPARRGAWPSRERACEGARSMAHYLAALGYRVGFAGKSHASAPAAYPFEKVGGTALDYDRIGEFIARDPRQPFALVVASAEPHRPWSKGDSSQYDAASLVLPPYFADTPETREALTRYYAEISFMDAQLGQVLDRLEQHAQYNNTLIMFYTEQGMGAPFAKWTLYDAGVRGSLVARWRNRIAPGRMSSALLQVNDLLPTWIEAAGAWPAPDMEGRSLLPLLLASDDELLHREFVYGVHATAGVPIARTPYPIRSIRDRRYKLIWNLAPENRFTNVIAENGFFDSWRALSSTDERARELLTRYRRRPELEFYDLETDPHEQINLAGRAEYLDRQEAMHRRLRTWMEERGDEGLATELQAPDRQAPGR